MAEVMLDHKIAIKRKRKAKIAAFVVLGIVLILATLIIIAACVPMNLKPSVIGRPDQITVYNTTSEHGQFASDQEQYKKFMAKFDDMFETNFLVALFSGRLGDYQVHDSYSDQAKALSDNYILSTLENNVLKKGYYVHFSYREPQTLRTSNGDVCTSEYTGIALTFQSLYFAISEKDAITTFEMYVPVKFKMDETNKKSTEYILKITQKANTSILYKALDEFKTM